MLINVTKTELPPLQDYTAYLRKMWKTAWITNNGQYHQELEKKLKTFLGIGHMSLVSNGTLAIQLAIRALQLKGEIITTPYTFAATTTAPLWEGLTPVFADIDAHTYNLSPLDAEKKITDKTAAILAVHVYGNPCDVEAFERLGKKYNIKILYDAAHAFGVTIKNRSVLRWGDASTLSFHATKVFNTIEGGAVIGSKKIIDQINLLKNFGIVDEETVVLPGINAKMNEFQAVMGLCNLRIIHKKMQSRKILYDRYKEHLHEVPAIRFQRVVASHYNYAYMPICLPNKKIRDALYFELIKNGIKPRKYFYPLTADFQFYKNRSEKVVIHLPHARDVANGILCLPIYSTLTLEAVDKISTIIKKFLLS